MTSPSDLLRSRRTTIAAIGCGQILAWGSSYYLLAVLAAPISRDTGWSLSLIVSGISIGLVIAGLVSIRVGGLIERHGGRWVLASSAILLSMGLAILALSPTIHFFLLGWVIIGVGMGAGLYDAAFSTLGRLYGVEARSAISSLTLWGGFASTVCWPLSAFLVETLGWRGACGTYALIHLMVSLPIYRFGIPHTPAREDRPQGPASGNDGPRLNAVIVLLAVVLTVAAFAQSAMSVHLLTILQTHGASLAAAVAIGGLLGPSQVAARVLERLFGRQYHPIWTMMASAVLVAVGLALLAGWNVAAVAVVLYGAGVGINSIARGALPLALFGPNGYPVLMGMLARPSLLAQAVAPMAMGFLIDRGSVDAATNGLICLAIVNVCLVAVLLVMTSRHRSQS